LHANVVWCCGALVGIRFEHPLEEDGFLKLRRSA
jgi:hypothetical protein